MEPGDGTPATTARFGDWFAVMAGAVTAAGISLTLTTFGAAIGLSVMSTAPTWRETSPWLWLVSGLYLVFVALWAFGLGGYVAGRLRHTSRYDAPERAFRDGLFGITSWGLALVLSAALAGFVALAARAPTQPATTAASSAAETLIPTELDQLFRDARGPRDASFAYHRAEAGRILLQLSSKQDLSLDDRDYLTALVAGNSAVALPEATERVNRAIANAHDAIHRARVAIVLQAFMVAVALALGAALAWGGAVEGGKERDEGRVPEWSWMPRRRLA